MKFETIFIASVYNFQLKIFVVDCDQFSAEKLHKMVVFEREGDTMYAIWRQ